MVQREPLVTVLMATHNGSRFIEEAITSVAAQSFKNFEFLIIDNASSDGTVKLIESLGEERIRIIKNESNWGLTKSLNLGLSEAKGEFIARIDDDDIWVGKEKLAKQVNFMLANPRVGLVGTQNIVISVDGLEMYRWQVATDDKMIRRTILRRNHFVHSGVLMRKSALDQVGVYDNKIRYAQDYELWLRIGQRWQLANLPDEYIKQRVNPRGVTSRHNMRQYLSFVRTAWNYRSAYPGWWGSLPTYGREFLVNLLPKPVFYKFGAAWRAYRR